MQENDEITNVNTISQRIKEARQEAGLSQIGLAKRAGVSQGTIGNLESGTRAAPRRLLDIARALDVRPEWLENGSGCKRLSPPESATIHHIPQAGVTVGEALEVLAAQFAGVDESTRAIIVILLGDLLAGRRTAGATAAAIEAMLKSAGDMPKKAGNGATP